MTNYSDYLHYELAKATMREHERRAELHRLSAQDAPARPSWRERLTILLGRRARHAVPRWSLPVATSLTPRAGIQVR